MRPPSPGAKVRFFFTSTATVFERPCGKLWRTWPASIVFLISSRPGRESFSGFFSVSLLVAICLPIINAVFLADALQSLDLCQELVGETAGRHHGVNRI